MNEKYQCSKAERRFYGLYFLGQNLVWSFASYVSTYLLDIGIDATIASVVLLAPKIWDAVNDTLFGFIVDKFSFKNKQKFMPWIKIGTVLLGVTIIVMFAIPSDIENQTAKLIWFVVAYLVFDAAYTMLDAPMYAMPIAMTTNIQERTILLSGNRLWGNVGGILGAVVIPLVRPKTGWFVGSIVFMAISAVFMFPFLFCGKERSSEITEDSEEKKEYTFKEMFNYVKTNKYLLLALCIILVMGCSAVESTLSLIMARNCFGDESMATVITACVALPVVLIAVITPKLTKKYDKTTLLFCGLAFAFVMSLAMYFVGYNSILPPLILLTLKYFGTSFYNVINYMLISDTVEYGTYKSGTRATGITFSLQTFTSKLKSAVVNSIVLFMLGLFGYDSSLAETAVQSQTVVDGIWKVFNLLPAFGYGLSALLLICFYKLRDKDVEVMAKYNNHEISREEAVAVLGKKYGDPA